MFERLKKVFNTTDKLEAGLSALPAEPQDAASDWAKARGFSHSGFGGGRGFRVEGEVGSKPWKLERGRSSRDYIRGDELRARAELKVNDDAAVLIMNRALKEELEIKTYEMYTDTLQTTADPSLPEELRWLAMYAEVGWDSVSSAFWKRYSVLADQKAYAQAWLSPSLADLLMSWPEPSPSAQMPFMLMLLRGKSYLRMQYTPADIPTLDHATKIFTGSCESALQGFGADIAL